jgi:hypothetical protein
MIDFLLNLGQSERPWVESSSATNLTKQLQLAVKAVLRTAMDTVSLYDCVLKARREMPRLPDPGAQIGRIRGFREAYRLRA